MPNMQQSENERADLAIWRERRKNDSAARKPRNKAKYYRKSKHRAKAYA